MPQGQAPDPAASALAALNRLQRQEPDAADLRWLADAARRWLAVGGAADLGRLLGLPSPAEARRIARDAAIHVIAAELPDGLGPWQRALEVEEQVGRHVDRGTFRRWLQAGGPPCDATPVQRAVHEVAVLTGGRGVTARTVDRVLLTFRQNSPVKCQAERRTMATEPAEGPAGATT